ncbi:hypothetical protein [Vibrio parahaemolyticus]|uniref:hypothetical protein n=1 Tax=Vibrio parahaemolyticus TaxID=670 RepID=UPI001111EE04|nr:hypothetical protein [Vibrio parahaemolyticus]
MSVISFQAFSAIKVHEPTSFSNKKEVKSVDTVNARGREMPLRIAMPQIAQRMKTVFVEPSLKELGVSWRANNESYERVLTRLARQYPVDIVVNSTAETIYVSVDKGQCTATRELKLDEIAETWSKVNISDQPILPPLLKMQADLAGYRYRLC